MKIKLNEFYYYNKNGDHLNLVQDTFDFNENTDSSDEQAYVDRYEKIIDILESRGYVDDFTTAYKVLINGRENELTLHDIFDIVSSKNGYDLVEYADGTLCVIGRENNPANNVYIEFLDSGRDNMTESFHNGPYSYAVGDRSLRDLYVCDYCLQAIESREGRQRVTPYYCDEEDCEDSCCDWCDECGFDTLYRIEKAGRA